MNFSRKSPQPRTPRGASRRPAINTYYRAKSDEVKPSPFRKKAASRNIRRLIFGFLDVGLILIILAGLIYSLIISPRPKVIINNQTFHNLNAYQAYANELFSHVKNRNKITYDEQAVTRSLEKRFPEISSVSTELPIFSERLTLRITIAQPSLKVKSGNDNFVVDSEGVIVAKSSQLPTAKSLPQIVDQSGFDAKIGQPLLNIGAVNFIKTIVAESKRANVQISTLTLPPVAQEMDLRAAGQAYLVKFYFGGDALTQIGQFLAARNHFTHSADQPAQYLDVRVNGKIFYK